tara:strand:- start:597 stop:896 length:300 start_codon:yes stop_codon:yes gene_type:complete
MKFYCFQKRQQQTGESAMFWFTSKAEAEKKLKEEVKNNPYVEDYVGGEDVRDFLYVLSDSVSCYNIPTDKKGLLRFLLIYVNIDNNQHLDAAASLGVVE